MNAMSEDLYHKTIIEWSKRTEHTSPLEKTDCEGISNNPLCGDRVSVELNVKGEAIQSMAHHVRGCLICKAASAHLASLARGLTLDKVKEMRQDLDKALKTVNGEPADFPENHRMFYPVQSHKSRHSCILLPYDAVIDALSSECME
ncbi:iron-sulfur cluster assembly scaffold protein [Deltaproteobacteria bacterium]|nr:iron-sulfur cluster assembly scaffold protein [Deltaproteobacteria bacterium]